MADVKKLEALKAREQAEAGVAVPFEETTATALRTAITPADTRRVEPFSTIRQGKSTNALTKLRATEGKNATIDLVTGEATIKSGNLILKIPNYAQLTGLKTSTYQLLDAITIALTETGAKSPTVVLSLQEYM